MRSLGTISTEADTAHGSPFRAECINRPGMWNCQMAIGPMHMKANPHARFNTKVSSSVAFETPSARFLYRKNRGFSGASTREGQISSDPARSRFRAVEPFVCGRNEPIQGWIRGLAHHKRNTPRPTNRGWTASGFDFHGMQITAGTVGGGTTVRRRRSATAIDPAHGD